MRKYIIIFLILFQYTGLFSQDTVPVKINKQYIKSYYLDARDIVISPIKWNKQQWLQAGIVGAFTGVAITQDLKVYNVFQRNKTDFTDKFSKYGIEPWGNGMYSIGITGCIYLYGVFGKHERSKRLGMLGAKTFIVTGIVNYAYKNLFHRHRPFQLEKEVKNGSINAVNQYEWDGPLSNPEYSSFPSGHTMSVFAMATIFASEYKEYKWVPVISYTIAGLTGLSRINDNRHWASDVVIGAAVGWGMAKLIYNHNNWGVKTTPYSDGKTTGMLMCVPIK